MGSAEVITAECAGCVLALGTVTLLVIRQALKEGWVKDSGNFAIVPPGRRWDTGTKTAAPAVAAGEAPAAGAVQIGHGKRGEAA